MFKALLLHTTSGNGVVTIDLGGRSVGKNEHLGKRLFKVK